MSLFPAFSIESGNSVPKIENGSHGQNHDWLSNPSFTQARTSPEVIVIDSPPVVNISDDSEPEVDFLRPSSSKTSHRHRHKKKKKKSSKSSKHLKSRLKEIGIPKNFPDDVNAKYYEDKTKQGGNLIVHTLHRPAIPLYTRKYWIPVGTRYSSLYHLWRFLGKNGRYFQASLTDGQVKIREGIEEEEEDEEHKEVEPVKTGKTGEALKGIWRTSRLELEVQHATDSFNKKLLDHPHDIRAWLEFLRFQDRASELQFRGGCSRRAMAQRKLDILSKALQENPRSWLLLREKVHLEQILYPPDELEQKMAKEVEEATSVGPWLAFLKVLQSRASTTEVSINYGKAMETARKEGRAFRRRTGRSPVVYDEQIIDLLFSSGLYMRQAGLWERLWTLLRMYLELNVKPLGSPEEKKPDIQFDVGLQPAGKEVEELETEVLKSGLPLSEIWLRIEGLRQSVRWLPLLPSEKDESEADLQRFVFPEDVSELVQPLATVGMVSSGIFTRLASVVLLLLKVPLLPCRDTALRRCGFPSWSCDTPEVLLTAVFSTGPWHWGKKALPVDLLSEMIAGGGGPQYLLPRPGRDLFLQSLQSLFKNLTAAVSSPLEKQSFGVWWLRFERWLLTLERFTTQGTNFSITQKRKKNLKSALKEFLSHEANRSSLALYREYALIEAALGKTDTAVKTLCTAATLGGYPVVGVKDRAELCSIYRTLAEVILKEEVDRISSENERHKVTPSNNTTDAISNVCDPSSSSSAYGDDNVNTTACENENQCSSSVEMVSVDRTKYFCDNQDPDINNPCCSSEKENDYTKCLVDGAESTDVINVSVVNVDIDQSVKRRSRWDMREAPVGAGGRKPRWTAASVFMGSVFSEDKCESIKDASGEKDSSQNEECPTEPRSRRKSNELAKSSQSKGKRKGKVLLKPRPKKISATTCEQKVIALLTCLGLGKPSDNLEAVATRTDIDSSLQRFKTVAEEVLKETGGTCQCPEVHEPGCKCLDMNGRGGGGMECFQSYFVVEWVSCRAWLLALVESVWAAGAAFEEALNKVVKVTVEELEEVEEKEEEGAEASSPESTGTHRLSGGRYNPVLVRIRNIREALYEGYITMLLSRRWSKEARFGLHPILSDVIRRALSEFPENVHFAAAVAVTESDVGFGGSPWWTVTSYFDGGLGRAGGGSESLFGKVFLILLAEQRRKRTEEGRQKGHEALNLGGPLVEDSCGSNRLKCVFRRLVADSGTKSCPLLWRLYLRFVGGMDGPSNCKGVVYRGLQECPWVKAFYLDAARLLPEENVQIQDLITERELRLHVSPEELEILRE